MNIEQDEIDITKEWLEDVDETRTIIKNGGYICIPFPIEEIRPFFPGLQQKSYVGITARTKVGKTAFMSWLMYEAIDFAYNHQDKISLNIRYFPLEETGFDLVGRYVSYLLKKLSNGKWRYSKAELSMKNNVLIPDEVYDFICNNEEFKKRLDFFNKTFKIMPSKNPTGIMIDINDFMSTRGEYIKQKYKVKDENGNEVIKEKKIGFKLYNKNEFNIIVVDHVGRVGNEKGEGLRESIARLSKDLYERKNFYGITPILVQQQTLSADTGRVSQVKDEDIKASVNNLGDCKSTAQDLNYLIGISDPGDFNKYDFNGFDIRKLGDYYRFGEILLGRDGGKNTEFNLFFDGKCCDYEKLPNPRDPNFERKMERFYDKIRIYKGQIVK